MEPDIKIDRIKIEGFKSIKSLDLELRNINILIGANGSGKSNLVSFFKMLNYMMSGGLQNYIASSGFAHSILHFGPKATREISSELHFKKGTESSEEYSFSLKYAQPDQLYFSKEEFKFKRSDMDKPKRNSFGSGHQESLLPLKASAKERSSEKYIFKTISGCRSYQFHDTSNEAHIKQSTYYSQSSSKYLFHDSGNLSAFLYALKKNNPIEYNSIVKTISRVEPFFKDFVLDIDNQKNILLNWIGNENPDYIFGPHQISDGLLRFMALSSLLLQPANKLPNVIIIDEPELGLHPFALNILAGLIKRVSCFSQIILATQSVRLIDQFDPEDIIVVEKRKNESTFKRQSLDDLKDWLEEYQMGQLWEKNILGGRPLND